MSHNQIDIKYVNNTGKTDFDVMVFTKNYSTRTPNIYYVAWQILRGQTSVYFSYPLDTVQVGASYHQHGQIINSGPFHADIGSSWKITQPKRTSTAILEQGMFPNKAYSDCSFVCLFACFS